MLAAPYTYALSPKERVGWGSIRRGRQQRFPIHELLFGAQQDLVFFIALPDDFSQIHFKIAASRPFIGLGPGAHRGQLPATFVPSAMRLSDLRNGMFVILWIWILAVPRLWHAGDGAGNIRRRPAADGAGQPQRLLIELQVERGEVSRVLK